LRGEGGRNIQEKKGETKYRDSPGELGGKTVCESDEKEQGGGKKGRGLWKDGRGGG